MDFQIVRVGANSTGVPSQVGSLSMRFLRQGLLEWMRGRESLVLFAWIQEGPIGICAVECVEAQEFLREIARPLSSHLVAGRLAVVRCCRVLEPFERNGIEQKMLERAIDRLKDMAVDAIFAQVHAGGSTSGLWSEAQFDLVADLGDDANRIQLLRRKLAA